MMTKSIILDTNLAVLLIVGMVMPKQVGVHKRTREYDIQDFNILSGVIANSNGLIFTPNVLTETSNLIRQTNDPLKTQLGNYMSSGLMKFSTEIQVESQYAYRRPEYSRLGLTDAVILHLSEKQSDTVIVTSDLGLYLAAEKDNIAVINFAHLRDMREDF